MGVKNFMTNYERYINELTEEKFIDLMILNCDACPIYPCNIENLTEDNGLDCYSRLKDWCMGGEAI